MHTVEEHQRTVAALLPGPAEPVTTACEEALGMVLAADVTAPISLPSFDNSAMDGYAVRSGEVTGVPVRLPVAADIPAGRTDVPALEPGTAHRIMTGAPLPDGADAVVKVELTDGGTDMVRIDEPVPAGNHVRRAGDDVAAGSTVLRAGTPLDAPALGLAAALGLAELPVHRRPRVLVVSTGSELVPTGTPLRHGQIHDSNGLMLAAAVRAAGAQAIRAHAVADDVAEFRSALRTDVDMILTSGGVSAGAYEVVKDALTDQGVRFTKVAMQPGGPQGAGRYAGVPLVTLPGNPVSSLVSFEVFVRPVLRAALGHRDTARPSVTAPLAEDVAPLKGRRQYRRGHYDGKAVRLVGGPGSHLLGALAESNCLVVIETEEGRLAAGTPVRCLLISADAP